MREYGTILLGGVIWCLALAVVRPVPFDVAWAAILLLLAPLVLVPLGLRLALPLQGNRDWTSRCVRVVALPAALLLGSAYLLPQGLPAAALAIPWLATTGVLAVVGLARVRRQIAGPVVALCARAALVYLAIGSAWAVLDRLGARPLGFEPVIVLLTAIHFHFAGFALPLVAALIARQAGGKVIQIAGVGVIAGVPMVAIGITTSQLQLGSALECIAAWVLGLSGMAVGWLQIRLARERHRPMAVRCLWTVAGTSLIAGMVLAVLYGSRHIMPIAGLDIPWMRAVHGTANAVGFAFIGLLGWTLVERHSSPRARTT